MKWDGQYLKESNRENLITIRKLPNDLEDIEKRLTAANFNKILQAATSPVFSLDFD